MNGEGQCKDRSDRGAFNAAATYGVSDGMGIGMRVSRYGKVGKMGWCERTAIDCCWRRWMVQSVNDDGRATAGGLRDADADARLLLLPLLLLLAQSSNLPNLPNRRDGISRVCT